MACYNLGDYICESRKQLGITQEELAFGICSTGTLSKIENGFVVPKRKNYEAIMQRLGKTMGICNIPNKASGANKQTIPANPRSKLLDVISVFVDINFS